MANHSSLFQFLQKKIFHTEYGTFKRLFTLIRINFKDTHFIHWDLPLFLKNPIEELKEAKKLIKISIYEIKKICTLNNCKLMIAIIPTKMEFNNNLKENILKPGLIAEYLEKIYSGI
jgi:hypothetical protein